ncbi:MAG: hypothetical protein Q8R82_16040, partial [Hyphomonadaceae bacterium]|nr:hypothetical protein [Hyphomonadaceae bacterium]
SDPAATFIVRANSKVAHDVVLVGEINDTLIPAMNDLIETSVDVGAASTAVLSSSDYMATSISSLALSTGSKTVALVEAGKDFAAGDLIVAVYRADPEIRLFMTVDSVASQTLTCTVPSDGVFGTGGPYANWLVFHAAFLGSGATAAMIWEGTQDSAPVSPKTLKDSVAWVPITYGATITPDVAAGFKRSTTLTGSPTIAAPTNPYDGAPLSLKFEMGSGGGSPSWNAVFDFGADGAPTFAAGLGKFHYVDCEYDAGRTKWRATYFPPA